MKRMALIISILGLSIQVFAVNVTVELRNSQGQLTDTGTVAYYNGGWIDLGVTSGGQVTADLPEANLKFRMTHAYASNEKYQHTGTDPVVVFQTVNTEVRLLDSQSAALDTGAVQYYSGGWHEFGTTQNGSCSLELLPYNYKFRMTYAFASNEKYQETGTDPVVTFQTVKTEVRLTDSQSIPLDPGTVQYYTGGWHIFGTTQNGACSLELLPYNYKFRMTYAYASNEKYQQTGTDPVVSFQTVNTEVRLLDSQGQPMDPGSVLYYTGGWRMFGSTAGGSVSKELLPYNYKFRMTYAYAPNEKYQNTGNDPLVLFPAVLARVRVNDANGSPVTGAEVDYYTGGWRDFGITDQGLAELELLPYNYKFRVTYEGESQEFYQNIGDNPLVDFDLETVIPTDLTLSIESPLSDTTVTGEVIFIRGAVSDASASVTVNGTTALVAGDGSFIQLVHLSQGANNVTVSASGSGGSAVQSWTVTYVPPQLPPDPVETATPLSTSEIQPFEETISFLYSGPDPVQAGVTPETIVQKRAAVLRGRVITREGDALSGVTVTILNHPELGRTLTREDGWYDMAVNGGGYLTLDYRKEGWLPAQRSTDVPWQDFTVLDSVAMVQLDPAVSLIDFSEPVGVARGSVVTDEDGTRQATLLFKQGNTATMVMPDGSTQPLDHLHIRATEYTVGEGGPAAMPAPLPSGVAYTYCVELTADEAIAAGAKRVEFDEPLPVYVDNFLGFEVGAYVPSGFYDPETGQWVASENGRVIGILGESGGLAEVDLDGDGYAESEAVLNAAGIDQAELGRLADLYSPGQTFWRVPVGHFTIWDFNICFLNKNKGDRPRMKSPKEKEDDKDCDDDDCNKGGHSIISFQSMSLGESIPITGTEFSLDYTGKRHSGREIVIQIPVTDTIPDILLKVNLKINIAGRHFEQSFEPVDHIVYDFVWDRRDAYGRIVRHSTELKYRIEYGYLGVVYAMPDGRFVKSFAKNTDLEETGLEHREWYYFTQDLSKTIKALNVDPKRNIGGWSIDKHHFYDTKNKILYFGDGRTKKRVRYDIKSIYEPSESWLNEYVAVGPDGRIYFSDEAAIYAMSPVSYSVERIAGTGEWGYSGDGGPAVEAEIDYPQDIEFGPDGCIYFVDAANCRVRKIDTDGIITTIAGSDNYDYIVEGNALDISFDWITGLAVSPDGSVFVVDDWGRHYGSIIWKITSDGYAYQFAGGLGDGYTGDGGPANLAEIGWVIDAEIAPDGSIYFTDLDHSVLRRIDETGTISTLAGNGEWNYNGDNIPATDAQFDYLFGLTVDKVGNIYFTETDGRIRTITPEGYVSTIASIGYARDGDYNASEFPMGIDISPDGNLYFIDDFELLRCVSVDFQDAVSEEIKLVTEDGRQILVFSSAGKHLKTIDALTGNMVYRFEYNDSGNLSCITDIDSFKTVVNYDASGTAVSVTSPLGQVTYFDTDSLGYLSRITNPNDETHNFTYEFGGLMTSHTDPRDYTSHYDYNIQGRLTGIEDPSGARISLSKRDIANGWIVTETTAEGRQTVYQTEILPGRIQKSTNTFENGLSNVSYTYRNGDNTLCTAEGIQVVTKTRPDPRFGLHAPLVDSLIVTTPSGLTTVMHQNRIITQMTGTEVTALADTVTVNGKTSISLYDGNLNRFTNISPEGRNSYSWTDEKGRVTCDSIPGVLAIHYTYDDEGFLTQTRQGDRITSFTYNDQGRLETITDPLLRTTAMEYDSIGRVTRQTLADNRVIDYDYDANGNLTGLTPPGKPAHFFGHTPVNLTNMYLPPELADSTGNMYYEYNLDRQLTRTLFSDSSGITVVYDTTGCGCGGGGKPALIQYGQGETKFRYSESTGQLTEINGRRQTTGGIAEDTLSFTYDGSLPTSVTWSGQVAGNLSVTYNSDFKVSSQSVNGMNTVNYAYDNDGLLMQAGILSLYHEPVNGRLTGTSLGNVTTTLNYSTYGELENYTARYGGSDIFNTSYTLDDIGRIESLTETVLGSTNTIDYEYDLSGRLSSVTRNGSLISEYIYDDNGNRIAYISQEDTISGVYDDQDRMLLYGNTAFGYDVRGSLTFKAENGDTTWYDYDMLGNLVSVSLPNGDIIEYLIDLQNRRIGKKLNGVIQRKWVYQDQINPVAEFDGNGNLISRFIYGDKGHVPAYMIKSGVIYRYVTDHLGSVRLVVNVQTGEVVQQLKYNEFGNVLQSTNPDFQPFAYAGGLFDTQTGLVRFGARDYDAVTGRWTAKDPIGFGNGSNYYVYSHNSTIIYVDPSGMQDFYNDYFEATVNQVVDVVSDAAATVYDAVSNVLPDAYTVTISGSLIGGGGAEMGFEFVWLPGQGVTIYWVVGGGLGFSVSGNIQGGVIYNMDSFEDLEGLSVELQGGACFLGGSGSYSVDSGAVTVTGGLSFGPPSGAGVVEYYIPITKF